MTEQTVKCTRADCDTDIPLMKENLIIVRPEVPLLSAQCPTCGKTRVLTKAVSKELSVLHFESELIDQQDEMDGYEEGPLMPSKDLSQMVKETLELLGYKGTRWTLKVNAIAEFVKSTSTYQNPSGLHTLLAAWKVDSQHIPMIVEKVFGSSDVRSQPQYNFNPNSSMGPMPNYAGVSRPVPVGAGYTMQQTPQGQVIIIPPAPQPQREPQRETDDTVTIVETVENGKVVSRTIKQKVSAQSNVHAAEQKSSAEELKSVMEVLKEFGMVGNKTTQDTSPPAVSPEVTKTLEKISDVLATIGKAQSSVRVDSTDRESAATMEYKNELKSLNDEIKKMREDQHKAEMSSLRDEISSMRRLVDDGPGTGLNDFQFEVDSKKKNLQTITSVVESTGNKVLEPLIEMQKMQSRLNGLLAVRQLEMEDQVPPGTYISAISPKREVPDEVVSNTLKTWRERAGAVREPVGDME